MKVETIFDALRVEGWEEHRAAWTKNYWERDFNQIVPNKRIAMTHPTIGLGISCVNPYKFFKVHKSGDVIVLQVNFYMKHKTYKVRTPGLWYAIGALTACHLDEVNKLVLNTDKTIAVAYGV